MLAGTKIVGAEMPPQTQTKKLGRIGDAFRPQFSFNDLVARDGE